MNTIQITEFARTKPIFIIASNTQAQIFPSFQSILCVDSINYGILISVTPNENKWLMGSLRKCHCNMNICVGNVF